MNTIYMRCCVCDALQMDRRTHQCQDCGHEFHMDEEGDARSFIQALIADADQIIEEEEVTAWTPA